MKISTILYLRWYFLDLAIIRYYIYLIQVKMQEVCKVYRRLTLNYLIARLSCYFSRGVFKLTFLRIASTSLLRIFIKKIESCSKERTRHKSLK